ncbi:MAG: AAA family ATPase [Lachnospiraceae bacterium]|nr:AAA family ATPase [Lachnospiraceae bacterium]
MSNYGLLGEKLGHSFSPTIHRQLWGGDYDLKPTPRDQVDEFFRKRDFSGINVTIPYKQIACQTCEHVDPKALAIGAVNTVVNRDGVLYGYNTDYDGFLFCARRAGVDFAGKKVLILGSGGTSLTARNAVADAGAREVVIISRSKPSGEIAPLQALSTNIPAHEAPSETDNQAKKASGEISAVSANLVGISRRCPVSHDTYDNLAARHSDAQIIVNTTPVGMYPNNYASPVDLALFPNLSGVVDVIYNPQTTLLVHEAKKKGIPATCGLPMLVAQAAYAAEHFCGRPFSADEIEKVLASVQAETANIVLIGMPGCGKTTVGKKLAEHLNREVIDVDALIVEREGRSIPDIFAEDGEEAFRQLETEAAKIAGQRSGVIISCGGGLPMREANHFPMLQNGRIYYLNRQIDKLATGGRPLSANRSGLPDMFAKRHPIYQSLCHRELPVTEGVPSAVINQILEDFYERPGRQS